MIKNNSQTILKVGAQTRLPLLITSISAHLESEQIVVMDSIGEQAAYIALKAVIHAKRCLPENQRVLINPGGVVIDTPQGERKAIRWTLELQQL